MRFACCSGTAAVHLSTTKLAWNGQRFHSRECFRESGMRKKRVHDQDIIYWSEVGGVQKRGTDGFAR